MRVPLLAQVLPQRYLVRVVLRHFLTKLTTILAGLFFLTSLTLFYLAAQRDGGLGSVTDSVVTEEAAPAVSDLPGGVTDSATETVLPAAAEDAPLPQPAE